MAKKKLSNLVQAMNLFVLLDERDKQTLADYVHSQTATPRKGKKKVEKDPICATCGNMESFADHNPSSDAFHKFRTTIKKKGGEPSE